MIRIVRFPGAALTEGAEKYIADGESVRFTSLAKTVADCFQYRNKTGLDVALEAVREVWPTRASTDNLWRYIKVCRVANVMRPNLESVT